MRRQAECFAELHADPAAADAMAFGLTFGDVEGMAESAEKLRQAKTLRPGPPNPGWRRRRYGAASRLERN
jgi:hypothetical protein